MSKSAHSGMFPARLWFNRMSSWSPVFRSADEFGRHTLVIGMPFVLSVVIPFRFCRCEDMAEFACTFPCCPHKAMTPNGRCMSHDEEFWAGEVLPA